LDREREEILGKGREGAGAAVNLSRFAGEVEARSVEGEGDRVASLSLLRTGPITLTRRFTPTSPTPWARIR
jgi:hypothetical protein